MNSLVPYRDENPYRRPSPDEAIAFWKFIYTTNPLGLVLYFLSILLFFVVFGWLARELLGNWIGSGLGLVIIVAIAVLPILFFTIPALPRSYEARFKEKLRPGIPKDELQGLLMDMTGKSLELVSVIFIAICTLCTLAYIGARYLALPGFTTLIIVVATAFNAFVILLIAVSLGGYNREFLRKTFTEEEYKRFFRFKNFKRAFITLVIFNALAVLALAFCYPGG